MDTRINSLRDATDDARKQVTGHQLYSQLTTEPAVRTFMEHHVWAVWDFMSLLTTLRWHLSCTAVPWVPRGDPLVRRLVNEINLAEESDDIGGQYLSHYELYLDAMDQAGADTLPVRSFVALIGGGDTVHRALHQSGAPLPALRFVGETFAFIDGAPLHCKAAAFAFGREDLIPEMFEQVAVLNEETGSLALFAEYLRRHISTDADVHGPMAMQMVAQLCGDSARRWGDAEDSVRRALNARARLWDGISEAITGG